MDEATRQLAAPPLTPLGMDPNGLTYFCFAFLLAAVIVVLRQRDQFDETSPRNEEDFMSQFLARDLASPREYAKGLFIYLMSMVMFLAGLSVLGPPVLIFLGIKSPDVAGLMPLAAALAIIGIVPSVPGLREIELAIRRSAHRLAFIPAAARATAERLGASKLDFAQYQTPEALTADEMAGVVPSDFSAVRGSIEYNWVRLCSLSYGLRLRQEDNEQLLDKRLLVSYKKDLMSLYETRSFLQTQVDRLRQGPTDADFRRNLRTRIREVLEKLYAFIGCSVRLRGGDAATVDQRLEAFGFDLVSVPEPSGRNDLMIVGLGVMACSVMAVCFAATELAKSGLWNPSVYFPTRAFDSFIWASTSVLIHGAAIFAADKIRARMIAKEHWFRVGTASAKSAANYVRIAIACAAVGYVVILFCGFALQSPTWEMARAAVPYALMPAATGGFYVLHLDNAELGQRPKSRLGEIAPQTIVTGLMGFVASESWVSTGQTVWPAGLDFVILVSIMGLTVGASLAWYIPDNAAFRKYDPLILTRESREREVRELALEKFNDPATTERWLVTEIDDLHGKSPLSALADARNFDEVLRHLSKASGVLA